MPDEPNKRRLAGETLETVTAARDRLGSEVTRLLSEVDRLQRELATVNIERPLTLDYQCALRQRDEARAELEQLRKPPALDRLLAGDLADHELAEVEAMFYAETPRSRHAVLSDRMVAEIRRRRDSGANARWIRWGRLRATQALFTAARMALVEAVNTLQRGGNADEILVVELLELLGDRARRGSLSNLQRRLEEALPEALRDVTK